MMFREATDPTFSASMYSDSVTVALRACIRSKKSASSVVMHAQGMLLNTNYTRTRVVSDSDSSVVSPQWGALRVHSGMWLLRGSVACSSWCGS